MTIASLFITSKIPSNCLTTISSIKIAFIYVQFFITYAIPIGLWKYETLINDSFIPLQQFSFTQVFYVLFAMFCTGLISSLCCCCFVCSFAVKNLNLNYQENVAQVYYSDGMPKILERLAFIP